MSLESVSSRSEPSRPLVSLARWTICRFRQLAGRWPVKEMLYRHISLQASRPACAAGVLGLQLRFVSRWRRIYVAVYWPQDMTADFEGPSQRRRHRLWRYAQPCHRSIVIQQGDTSRWKMIHLCNDPVEGYWYIEVIDIGSPEKWAAHSDGRYLVHVADFDEHVYRIKARPKAIQLWEVEGRLRDVPTQGSQDPGHQASQLDRFEAELSRTLPLPKRWRTDGQSSTQHGGLTALSRLHALLDGESDCADWIDRYWRFLMREVNPRALVQLRPLPALEAKADTKELEAGRRVWHTLYSAS